MNAVERMNIIKAVEDAANDKEQFERVLEHLSKPGAKVLEVTITVLADGTYRQLTNMCGRIFLDMLADGSIQERLTHALNERYNIALRKEAKMMEERHIEIPQEFI